MRKLPRSSGILLHPSSLPGQHGIGDFGIEAYQFVDFLVSAKQTWWQTLPLGPLGFGNSPYNSPSAFAGNPLFISVEQLLHEGMLDHIEDDPTEPPDLGHTHYEWAKKFKERHLRRAYNLFIQSSDKNIKEAFSLFCQTQKHWLSTFSKFCVLKSIHENKSWLDWPDHLDLSHPNYAQEVEYHSFVQYLFFSQWKKLRTYANEHGIKIIGDVPIFVALDSADVWANRNLFQLKENGQPNVVAGVPPDYFSEDGQLWGNPLYDWPTHKKLGFSWWIARLSMAFELFDAVRLDHFIGFHRAWAIPFGAPTARQGEWQIGPGEDLFNIVMEKIKKPLFIAEDLGLLIPEVEDLRDQFNFPGMKVLQFSFGDPDEFDRERPLMFPENTVVYTGTHDNNTMRGWFDDAGSNPTLQKERQFALDYARAQTDNDVWGMITLAARTPSVLSIIPTQDLLNLGAENRMNTPATSVNNWRWRMLPGALTKGISENLKKITEEAHRATRTSIIKKSSSNKRTTL